MRMPFKSLCEVLATDRGGFTLWLGAGASIALSGGKTPSWRVLVDRIRTDHGLPPNPVRSAKSDLPLQLEGLSAKIGHVAFRKELWKRVVEPLLQEASIDKDVFVDHSIIGARANVVVSFNIETMSSHAFVSLGHARSVVPRTFRERNPMSGEVVFTSTPGPVSPPVFFPHGLLDQGNVVMTESEYIRHRASLAMSTAIHLSLGSDLVIVGMSLADSYLRRALLKHRRWIREIFWIGAVCPYHEWARVADVTFVQADHGEIWKGLAETFLARDQSDRLRAQRDELRSTLDADLAKLVVERRVLPMRLETYARLLLTQQPTLSDAKFAEFVNMCVDSGQDVPKCIQDRYPSLVASIVEALGPS